MGEAWPFLVARGRRRGYSALLVPGFLGEHGFLEETAVPLDDVSFRTAATPFGSLTWAEHAVTAGDAGREPRDEHGRPLVLLHGFLCPRGEPDDAGAALARTDALALAVYRRFLDGEEEFRAEASAPFEVGLARVAALRPVRRQPVAISAPPRRKPRRGLVWAGAGAVVAGAVAAVVALVSAGSGPEPPPPCPRDVVTLSPQSPPVASCVLDGKIVGYASQKAPVSPTPRK
ncbi:hypothetical protein [Amycolatopsis saalfeldensis]|uniref:Uncharacterized protein n=1 Tax=Amycolatopsis saalfeldensis TaxID=394193 RepID=A0A1H8X005_9PSEU|nr:hypothetical protein [Amycolatopsis saalfeldensis]SEP33189.1 hypothetical protein SAMN04489732_106109 [Amycolatopsis saalfeldensis]